MHRFRCPIERTASRIELTDTTEIHHLKNVLRLKPGGKIIVFDGKGLQARGEITELKQNKCTINVSRVEEAPHKELSLILACAIPKKGKFETVIEKATELGVAAIIPLKTKRTEVDLKGERAAKKRARFVAVALNAAKQSGRADIPRIEPIASLGDCLKRLKGDCLLLMAGLVEPRKPLTQIFPLEKHIKKIAVFIGPEGDFTDDEYALARKEGAEIVSLGEHVLKVETAALSSISFIQLMTGT